MKNAMEIGSEPPDPGSGPRLATTAASLHSPAPAVGSTPESPLRKVSRPQVFYPFPPSGAARKSFYATHFPGTTQREWSDWRWQLKNRITSLEAITQILPLSRDEMAGITLNRACLPLAVTPYYASLLDPDAPDQGLRRCVIPSASESLFTQGESVDPLGEEHDSPTPGLVHRYPNRVLFLVTDFCSTYCRYCTRSRGMGGAGDIGRLRHRWEKALAYIEATPAVQDVLLSGGDALTLPDEALEWLLARVSRIPHVEFVRIGTKVPAVLPQRITKSLTRMLRKYHPLWMSLHFTHPDELTPESAHACAMLADAGIPLGSQTVLLAGGQRQRPDHEVPVPGPAQAAGAPLLPVPVRPHRRFGPISAPRWPPESRSCAPCAARSAATPCPPTSSTRRAAGARFRSPRTSSPAGRTGTSCSPIPAVGHYRYPDYTPDASTPQ